METITEIDSFLWNHKIKSQAFAELDQRCFRKNWKIQEFLSLSKQKNFQGRVLINSKQGECAYLVFFLIPPEIQILRMGVRPEHRRKGLASRMLHELELEAIANQNNQLWLDVHSENVPALELYKKFGFKEMNRRKDYYQHPIGDAILMKKNLL